MTGKLIYALLRANKAAQNAFYAQQAPRSIFPDLKAEIRWIYDYRERNKVYPSLSAFKARFPQTMLPRTKETVEEAFQLVMDHHLYSEVAEKVDKAKQMYEGGQSMAEVVGYMRQALQDISTFDTSYIDVDIERNPLALSRYRARVLNKSTGKSYPPSPWPTYNELVSYSEPGEHNLIASRLSIGKSWLALQWAVHYAQCGERVLIVSKEMPSHQISDRLECLLFKLSHPKFRKGELTPKQRFRWIEGRKRLKYSKSGEMSGLFPEGGAIIVTGQETIKGVGFNHIISKIQQYRPTVLFVDGAYLITPEGLSRNANKVEQLTYISNTMKRLCVATPLIGYSVIQVNREGETKSGESVPSIKNIYGADVWAQDADNVILIGGRRGAKVRTLALAKGRESNIGEFSTKFELDPHPDFSEVTTLKSVSSGAVEFHGI